MRQAILQRLKLNFWPFTRVPSGPAFPEGPASYSASEKELIVRQLRAGNQIAREFARGRGYSLHPLLADKPVRAAS